jgi:hypothetical protein
VVLSIIYCSVIKLSWKRFLEGKPLLTLQMYFVETPTSYFLFLCLTFWRWKIILPILKRVTRFVTQLQIFFVLVFIWLYIFFNSLIRKCFLSNDGHFCRIIFLFAYKGNTKRCGE